jgi:hypothetical protein
MSIIFLRLRQLAVADLKKKPSKKRQSASRPNLLASISGLNEEVICFSDLSSGEDVFLSHGKPCFQVQEHQSSLRNPRCEGSATLPRKGFSLLRRTF